MASLYEELIISTAEDGASTPCGPTPNAQPNELEELMDAWLQERHHSIEYRMFLDRACHLLMRILAEGELSPQTARRARALMRAVRAADRDSSRPN
ncbi:MAG: hypothetical protein P4L84_00425 [Isosphaeraceae bacterium]|nr:hypothetical protein [Isosphaeraceae bacterium]